MKLLTDAFDRCFTSGDLYKLDLADGAGTSRLIPCKNLRLSRTVEIGDVADMAFAAKMALRELMESTYGEPTAADLERYMLSSFKFSEKLSFEEKKEHLNTALQKLITFHEVALDKDGKLNFGQN